MYKYKTQWIEVELKDTCWMLVMLLMLSKTNDLLFSFKWHFQWVLNDILLYRFWLDFCDVLRFFFIFWYFVCFCFGFFLLYCMWLQGIVILFCRMIWSSSSPTCVISCCVRKKYYFVVEMCCKESDFMVSDSIIKHQKITLIENLFQTNQFMKFSWIVELAMNFWWLKQISRQYFYFCKAVQILNKTNL